MSVITIEFLVFVLFLALLYYIVPGKFKPYIILLGNVAFYLSFNYLYSLFLLFTILTTYFSALKLEQTTQKNKRKMWLVAPIITNVGILLTVKYLMYYLNLIDSVFSLQLTGVSLLVPIGISFYTLQTVGYCIDVYRGDVKAERHFFKYMSFATFFPLILQGPISRYNQLAHQLFKDKNPEDKYYAFTRGSQLILWGLFKKMVVADRAAILVGTVFNNHTDYMAWPILVASLFYTLQIYADFSGFVDISRGIGQIFGIDVIQNFKQPYLATSIVDFWRRWHISLSSWLRDYVYIPLGGNRKGVKRKYLNILLVFFVSGIWHGVGLQFIAWGLLHGFYQIVGALSSPYKMKLTERLNINRNSKVYTTVQRFITFGLIVISWIVFRSESLTAALRMIKRLFFNWGGTQFADIYNLGLDRMDFHIVFVSVLIILIHWVLKENGISVRELIRRQHLVFRWSVYLSAMMIILILGIYGPGFSDSSFIYMNF